MSTRAWPRKRPASSASRSGRHPRVSSAFAPVPRRDRRAGSPSWAVSLRMNTPSEAPSKDFASTLALAIEAGCLTYRDTIPWADATIARLDHPPLWICDLSTVKYRPDALRVIRDFLRTDPSEPINTKTDEYLGFLWIRYQRRELSWATFLNKAGQYSDASSVGIECEYFYEMLNELEEADFGLAVEARQQEKVRQRLDRTISTTRRFYEDFRKRG